MIVVDASALVDFLAPVSHKPLLDARIQTSIELHTPHLADVEVAHALRRMVAHGTLGADRAADARYDLMRLPARRYAHTLFLERAWELRHSVSTYDAIYIALAEALDAPLVTCDAALARARGIRASVEVYAPA